MSKKIVWFFLIVSLIGIFVIRPQSSEAAPEIPVASNSKSASNWSEFQNLIKDVTVDEIKLIKSFSATSSINTRDFPSRNLKIDGQGQHTLDMGSQWIKMGQSSSDEKLFTVKSLSISGSVFSNQAIFHPNDNTIHFQDVRIKDRGVVDGVNSNVYFSGNTTIETGKRFETMRTIVDCRNLIIEDNFSYISEKQNWMTGDKRAALFSPSTANNPSVAIINSNFTAKCLNVGIFELNVPTKVTISDNSNVNIEKSNYFIEATEPLEFAISDSKLILGETKKVIESTAEINARIEKKVEIVGKENNDLGIFNSKNAPTTIEMSSTIFKGTKDIGCIAKTEGVSAQLTVKAENSKIELEKGGFFYSIDNKVLATFNNSQFLANRTTRNFLYGQTIESKMIRSSLKIESVEAAIINVPSGFGGSKLNFVDSEIHLRQDSPLTNSMFVIENKETEIIFDKTHLDSKSNGRLFSISDSATDSKLSILNGSKWEAYSKSNNVFRTGSNINDTGPNEEVAKRGTKNFLLRIDGKETKVNFSGNSNREDLGGGILAIVGPSSRLEMDNGAYLSVKSLNQEAGKGIATPSIMIQSLNGGFYLDNDSALDIENHSVNPPNNTFNQEAAIRFRTAGSMTFQIDNRSSINILKKGVSAGVRMFGGNNKLFVSNGSDFNVHNIGDGKASDGGYAGNMAVQFISDSESSKNQFAISGKDSNINLVADFGLAIDGSEDQLDIITSKDTYFVARGQSNSANVGIFNAKIMNIDFNTMIYSDFANTRLDGGAIFSANEETSTLKAAKTNLSLWTVGKGQNVMRTDPDKYLASQQFNLSGVNLATFSSGSDEIKSYFTEIGSTNKISRMTGNNQRAIVDVLRVPTNADKNIWAHAVVKEGKESAARPAYENEVFVKVEVRNPDDSVAYTTQGVSIGNGTDGEGSSIYGEKKKTGLVKIPIPGGQFIEAGQTVEVVEAWIDLGNNETRPSEVEDLTAGPVTALDVTPPKQALVSHLPVTNAVKQLVGTAEEEGAKVFFKVNNVWLKNSEGELITTTVDGKFWVINLPFYVTKLDKIDVFLKDNTVIETVPKESLPDTYTMEPDDIYGNINQAAENYSSYKGYHDAIDTTIIGGKDHRFASALRSITEDVIPIPKLEQSVVSSGGEVTSHEDILTYKFKVANVNKKAEPWKKVVLTNVLATGLRFDPDNHGITLNGLAATEEQFFYEASTQTLTIKVGDIKGNEIVDVEFKVKVSRKAALGKNILNKGTATGESPQEELFTLGANTPESIYKIISINSNEVGIPGNSVYGLLSFVSVPENLDFGNLRYSATTKRVEEPKFKQKLVIGDSRANVENGWYMTATLTQPMLNEKGKELINALRYVYKGKEMILDTNAKVVYTKLDVKHDEYIVSDTWGNKKGSDGVKLQIEGKDAVYTGSYQGIITWKLLAGQP